MNEIACCFAGVVVFLFGLYMCCHICGVGPVIALCMCAPTLLVLLCAAGQLYLIYACTHEVLVHIVGAAVVCCCGAQLYPICRYP